MVTSYPLTGNPVSHLPPAPAPLVYWGREINNDKYITTGAFEPNAPDQTAESLRWCGTLCLDFDVVDFVRSRGSKSGDMRTTQSLKPLMWESDPEKLAKVRVKHLETILAVLDRVCPGQLPTHVVDSGWGFHFYFWLMEPCSAEPGLTALRETNERLMSAINESAGYNLADTIAHNTGLLVLRPAGSTNNKAAPKLVSVHSSNPSARWGNHPLPALAPKKVRAPVAESTEWIAEEPTALPERVAAIFQTAPKVRGYFEGKGKPAKSADGKALDVSGSGYGYTMACALARKGCTHAEIAKADYLRPASKKDLRECNRIAAQALADTSVTSALVLNGAEEEIAKKLQCSKAGPKPSLLNAVLVVTEDSRWKDALYFDERTLEMRFTAEANTRMRSMLGVSDLDGIKISDEDVIAIRLWLSRVYAVDVGKDVAFDALSHACQKNTRNTLVEALDSYRWDGVKRIDTWLRDYAEVADSALSRAYARKTLISAVARAYASTDHPHVGCKVDTVLVLQGGQGARKSALLRALAGGEQYFSDTHFDIGNKDAYLQIHRPWIYECAELTHFSKREIDTVKAFLTSQSDNFRAPYLRISEDHPRQGIFVGSTNERKFLDDPTGSRRFWPVIVGVLDVPGLELVHEQLWAEAVLAYRQGDTWWLTPDQEALRITDAEEFTVEDPTAVKLAEWIGKLNARPFSLLEALQALDIGPDKFDARKKFVAAALTKLECVHKAMGPKRVHMWIAPAALYGVALETAVSPDLFDLETPIQTRSRAELITRVPASTAANLKPLVPSKAFLANLTDLQMLAQVRQHPGLADEIYWEWKSAQPESESGS